MRNKILFIILLLAVFHISNSQQKVKNTIAIPEMKSLNLGFDISSPLGRLIEEGWNNYEMSLMVGGYKKFYFQLEAGVLDYSIQKQEYSSVTATLLKSYDYKANGGYFRFGADYNLFKRNKPDEQNMIFFGGRYGFSKTLFSASNIFINDTIWGPRHASMPESSLTSHWLEATGGIKVQFTRYFSMGWSVRYKFFLYGSDKKNKPYFIAGYGKSAENNAFGVTYSLYFTLPLKTPSLKSKM